jgi:hypothetical protein
LQCRSCGDPVDPRRVELGYDYCLKEECQRRCLKPVTLAAVGVNKAADYYTTPDEVLPPPPPVPPRAEPGEDDDDVSKHKAQRTTPARVGWRPLSTIAKLHRLEEGLDNDLAEAYERFQRGQTTALQMEKACDDLIAAFNQKVMSENIRFRSMLRPRRRRGR